MRAPATDRGWKTATRKLLLLCIKRFRLICLQPGLNRGEEWWAKPRIADGRKRQAAKDGPAPRKCGAATAVKDGRTRRFWLGEELATHNLRPERAKNGLCEQQGQGENRCGQGCGLTAACIVHHRHIHVLRKELTADRPVFERQDFGRFTSPARRDLALAL
jgi:hypothetical protein